MNAAVCPKVVVLLLLIHFLLWLPLIYGDFVIVLCFVVLYLASFLVLQSSRWEKESWWLYFNFLFMAFD